MSPMTLFRRRNYLQWHITVCCALNSVPILSMRIFPTRPHSVPTLYEWPQNISSLEIGQLHYYQPLGYIPVDKHQKCYRPEPQSIKRAVHSREFILWHYVTLT